jgi:membrane fusion protein (multidrug efflux system)
MNSVSVSPRRRLSASSRHLVSAASLAGLLSLLTACNRQAATPPAPPPAEVTVQTVQPERVAVTNESPGRLNAVRVAQVRARVAGILLKRTFTEGTDVKEGDKLFEIDPAPFAATAQSAKAAVAKAEANAKQTELLAERYKGLIDLEAVSKQEYDNAQAASAQAQADVQAAKAALSNAELNLGYATVTAPISGRIGRALVTEGALVGQNESTQLAQIQQLDPIYFDFTQSTTDLLKMRRAIAQGKVKLIAPDTAQVTLLLEDGTKYAQPGKMLFSDVAVDTGTSMVTLRAEFPNPDKLLLPGMFGRARVEQAVDENALTILQRAASLGNGGTATAMVVTADNKVEARNLKLGSAVGDKWIVNDGLKAGDRVIVEGLQKVRPGATVNPLPYNPSALNPAVSAAPSPAPASAEASSSAKK